MTAAEINAIAELQTHQPVVLIATVDDAGMPHLATATELFISDALHIRTLAWLCPTTLCNLQDNRQISVTIWDAIADHGLQLPGYVENIQSVAMLDGYAGASEETHPCPQQQYELTVHVDQALPFSRALHSHC